MLGLIAWGGPTGARVWDRKKKNFATPFLPHAGPVATLAFSADGIAPGDVRSRQQARVFRIPSTKPDPSLSSCPALPGGIRNQPRGRRSRRPSVCGRRHDVTHGRKHDSSYFLHWRSATTGESLAMSKAQGHDYLGAFDVSPHGDRVAAIWDGDGLLWDAHRRMAVAAFPAGAQTWCEDTTFSADGKIAGGGGHDMTVIKRSRSRISRALQLQRACAADCSFQAGCSGRRSPLTANTSPLPCGTEPSACGAGPTVLPVAYRIRRPVAHVVGTFSRQAARVAQGHQLSQRLTADDASFRRLEWCSSRAQDRPRRHHRRRRI